MDLAKIRLVMQSFFIQKIHMKKKAIFHCEIFSIGL